MGEQLPRDVLFEIALHMDAPTLRKFCRSDRRASRICSDPYFRDVWLRYHDQLSLQQRREIDAVIDRIVEDLINDAGFIPSDEDLIKIKKSTREKFKTIIGRDLRPIIVQALPNRIQAAIAAVIYRSATWPNFRATVDAYLRHEGIYEIFNNVYKYFSDVYVDSPNFFPIVINGITDILSINGFTDLENFEQIAQNIPELRSYEEQWYSLFPKH